MQIRSFLEYEDKRAYAEIKMLATGNPYIKEKIDLDIQVQKLKLLKSNFLSEKYSLEDKIIKYYPQRITSLENRINGLIADVETAKQHPKPTDDRFVGMEVKGVFYSEKADAGKAIIEACKEMTSPAPVPLGKYRGFETELAQKMRKRNIQKIVRFSRDEAQDLQKKAKKACLSEAGLIRLLLRGYEPREKPDERFYDVMRELSSIGNNINQLAVKANALGFVDAPQLKKEAERWHKFQADIERTYLRPDKSEMKWQ